MKPFVGRILICVIPLILGGWVVAAAWRNYGDPTARPRFLPGVDLAGGSVLVYEIDRDYWNTLPDATKADVPAQLAARLKRRIDPNNLLEITIRPINTEPPRVEIVLPMTLSSKEGGEQKTGQAQIDEIKSRITQAGRLEFRLLADTRPFEGESDQEAIESARGHLADLNPPFVADAKNVPPVPESLVGRYGWLELGPEEVKHSGFNENTPEGFRMGVADPGVHSTNAYFVAPKVKRYFVLTKIPADAERVTGDDLERVRADLGGQTGMNYVGHFSIRGSAQERMWELTKPKGHYMAIIFDNKVTSAPSLNDRLRDNIEVSMGTGPETKKRIDELVLILQAGALPATLNPQPVSELTMGPSLGEDTIRAGLIAVVGAYLAVLAFMVVYYRFAGVVACVALFANLILTVAVMIGVNAAFTLPGLAGLVLMLGMAVDANVLIYERLREERERGAGLAQAIRNAYERALPTILDTHFTSIFTAIVLYVVGTDQLKGFGVSLTIGLVVSLFTSLYMTKVFFDVALAKGWVKDLKFMELFKRPNIDFMAVRKYWFAATVILSVLGLAVFISRGEKGLNIDFTGGTAYMIEFKEPVAISSVRNEIGSRLPEASVDALYRASGQATSGTTTEFTIRTTEKDRVKVREAVKSAFGDKLKYVELDASALAPADKPNRKHKVELTLKNKAFTLPQMEQEIERWFTAEPRRIGVPKEAYTLEGVPPDKDGTYEKFILQFTIPDEIAAVAKPEELVDYLKSTLRQPVSDRLENFDSQLATETQQRAIGAIGLSWLAIVLFLWFRFGNWTFGVAAVLCLIHDLTFTVGVIGVSSYLYNWGFGGWLGLEDFKIDLPAVAALLTLVGYSVNDTIVVFDRIREMRGKNQPITPQLINESVNATLSRTVLASLTTWLVVVVLYIFGGSGVHLFSFVMVVGVIIGTYSSIFVASPLLLIFGEGQDQAAANRQTSGGKVPARV